MISKLSSYFSSLCSFTHVCLGSIWSTDLGFECVFDFPWFSVAVNVFYIFPLFGQRMRLWHVEIMACWDSWFCGMQWSISNLWTLAKMFSFQTVEKLNSWPRSPDNSCSNVWSSAKKPLSHHWDEIMACQPAPLHLHSASRAIFHRFCKKIPLVSLESECDVLVIRCFYFLVVLEKIGTGKKSRNRYRKNLVP